jgi:hypothetical protein
MTLTTDGDAMQPIDCKDTYKGKVFVSVFPPYFPPYDYRDKELQFNRLGSRLSFYGDRLLSRCFAYISHDVSKGHF